MARKHESSNVSAPIFSHRRGPSPPCDSFPHAADVWRQYAKDAAARITHAPPPPAHQRKQAEDCRRRTRTSLRGPPLDEAPPARKLEEKSNFPEGPAQDLHARTLFLPPPPLLFLRRALDFLRPLDVNRPIRETPGNGSRPECLLSHSVEESATLFFRPINSRCVFIT